MTGKFSIALRLAVILGLTLASAPAAITINTQFGQLFNSTGVNGIGAGKVGILVADEGQTPGLANANGTVLQLGAYLGGSSDDRIIGITTSVANVSTTGVSGIQALFENINYSGNFGAGDKLYILWFPTLTDIGSIVTVGTTYGAYRSDVVNTASGSDIAFIAPADGFSGDLFAYLDSLASGSGVTVSDFTAKLVAVPEPSVLALLGVGAFGAFLLVRGRRRNSARRAILPVVFGMGSLTFCAPQAGAQIWQNPGSGDWYDSANWVGGFTPSPGDGAYFGNGGTAIIGSGTASFSGLGVAGPSGQPSTVHVQSGATLDAGLGDIRLGDGFDTSAQRLYGPGNLLVTGLSASASTGGDLYVGYNAGQGTLTVTGGGAVTSAAGYLGHAGGGLPASGSSALVAGAGSKWTADSVTLFHDSQLTVANSGSIVTNSLTVGLHATLSGNGSVTGSVILDGTISTGGVPATLSTGGQTWNGGAHFGWSINDATESLTPGDNPGWSFLSITGGLAINATNLNPFVIDIGGTAANFSGDTDYTWTVATVTTAISGFTGDKFQVVASGLTNSHPGQFGVAVSGNSLQITYIAVPEVSATGVVSGAGLVLAILLRRRVTPSSFA